MEDRGKTFTGKDVSADKEKIKNFVNSRGAENISEASRNISGVKKVFDEVKEIFLEDVKEIEKSIDPNREQNDDAYTFFSPVIGKSINKFRNSLEKGDSIDEVDIREVAEKDASTRNKYASDLLNSPISNIVRNHVTIKKLQEESESYDEINDKIKESGAGSLESLMDFFKETVGLMESPQMMGSMDSKVLRETLDKHNILLNAVSILLKEMGINNPSFDGARENLEKSLSNIQPKSIENVRELSTKEKETNKEISTERSETKTVESIKSESKITETVSAPRESTEKNISAEKQTIPLAESKNPPNEVIKTEQQLKSENKSIEGTNSDVNPPQESKAPSVSPSIVENKTVIEKPIPVVTPNPAVKTTSENKTTAEKSSGSIEGVPGKEQTSKPGIVKSAAQSLIEQLGLGSIINEDNQNKRLTKTENIVAAEPAKNQQEIDGIQQAEKEKTETRVESEKIGEIQKIKDQISIDQIKPLEVIKTEVDKKAESIRSKIEKSPVKMIKEIPEKIIKGRKEEKESGSESISKKIEESTDAGIRNETKKESVIKYEEKNGSDPSSKSEESTDMNRQILNSILMVMQEIRETLNGPLIVTNSENKFE